jgi:pantoate--beta-alanine ligase
MKILNSYTALKQERAAINGKLAFVPTMGALHEGHLALVREARKYADKVIVSIFVNPTQFGKNEDFGKYPRMPEKDAALLAGLADYIYLPRVEDIYPHGEQITKKAGKEAEGLDGQFRPGHFDGVVTVVSILFDHVQPDVALFGEKDYQQLMVIREMNYPGVKIIGVPTLREPDGLALSSRNAYLTAEERKLAPLIHQILKTYTDNASAVKTLEQAGFRVQYLEKRWNRLLVAAYLGTTRLIDNIAI